MLEDRLFEITNPQEFEEIALQVFKFQYERVKTYQTFCKHLKKSPTNVKALLDIPFLPISFFKSDTIISEGHTSEITFTSSGTTGSITSKHSVASLKLYEKSFSDGFERFYGPMNDWTIIALLPSYLERGGSSLVYMVDHLIQKSQKIESGFYLDDYLGLIEMIHTLEKKQQKAILIGVSYALLDLIEMERFNLKSTVVMETGGMKGKRRELIKSALHEQLKSGFGVKTIHSEYGMTELLSQAYSSGHGIYNCPPWMQIHTRDTEDPLSYVYGKTGGINVIDLANLYSCSFIATQDLGKLHPDGSFEILGRFDNSDIRGCNLMLL